MKQHLAIAVIVAVLASCMINPVSGEREFPLISEHQEIDFGRAAAAAAETQLGLVDDPELQAYVQLSANKSTVPSTGAD